MQVEGNAARAADKAICPKCGEAIPAAFNPPWCQACNWNVVSVVPVAAVPSPTACPAPCQSPWRTPVSRVGDGGYRGHAAAQFRSAGFIRARRLGPSASSNSDCTRRMALGRVRLPPPDDCRNGHPSASCLHVPTALSSFPQGRPRRSESRRAHAVLGGRRHFPATRDQARGVVGYRRSLRSVIIFGWSQAASPYRLRAAPVGRAHSSGANRRHQSRNRS